MQISAASVSSENKKKKSKDKTENTIFLQENSSKRSYV